MTLRGHLLFELRGADLAPPRAVRPLLTGVTLDLAHGEIGVLLGANGSGKTTLLRSAAGLWPLSAGVLLGPGPDATALLLENPAAQFVARSVAGEVEFALESLGLETAAIGSRTRDVLEGLGLGGLADRDPATLSPGEQERALLAAALAPGPRLLLLDDPYLYLGPGESAAAWQETMSAVRTGRVGGVLLATQDAELAVAADRVGFLEGGRLTAWGDPDSVLRHGVPRGVDPPLGLWIEEGLRERGFTLPGTGYDLARFLERIEAGLRAGETR